MKQTTIWLLDCYPGRGLSAELEEVLNSSPEPKPALLHIETSDIEQCLFGDRCPDFSQAATPNLILLILSPALMERSGSIIQGIRRWLVKVPIIIAIESADPQPVFELLKFKAVDFITPPFNSADLLPRIWKLLEQAEWRDSLMQTLKGKHGCKKLVGESPVFLKEVEKVPLVSSCDASVLISGETGTGKEMFARAVHYLSPRASKPFIPVNCGAIPTELIESELFGHERGAFTGATIARPGIIQEAKGGTLFLDEIDSLPLLAQVKLLRFLQEKEYRALGSSKVYKADVRIIAASNIDFEEAVRLGRLRRDLYYRLNVIPLRLPSLKERREDIPLLAHHFLNKFSVEFERKIRGFSTEAIQCLMMYDWPGNVRELEHVIERAVLLCDQEIVQTHFILLPQKAAPAPKKSFQQIKSEVITQFERNYIYSMLLAHDGNISKAARAAQKNRRAFWGLINKHKIDVAGIRQTIKAC